MFLGSLPFVRTRSAIGNAMDVEQELMLAGIRLSNLLNQISAGIGCKAIPRVS